MEKRVYKLNIDLEFAGLIPPMAQDERKMLEESIRKDGCTDPLIVWNGTIIDGHNRYSICTNLNIPFAYEQKDELSDRNAVKAWIIQRQLARRNLTKYQRSELALAFEPIFKEEAKKKQSQAGKEKLRQNSSEASEDRRTRKKVADIAGVSHDTITRVKKIDAVADEETKKKLENGDASINQVYTELFGNKTPDTVKMVGKKAIHVEGKMPDVPDSFPVVLDLLDEVKRNYLVSLEHILLQYTPGMVTEENTKKIRSMFNGAASQATKIINQRIQEVTK